MIRPPRIPRDPHVGDRPESCIGFGIFALMGVAIGLTLGYWWWG